MEHIELPANQHRSVHSYQSAWMAHWTGVSCNASERVINGFVNDENIRDINYHHEISRMDVASNASRSVNHFGETETRSFQTMNKCVRTRNLRNEGGQGTLALWNGNETDKILVSTSRIDENVEDGKVQRHTSRSYIPSAGVAATEISSKECCTRPESMFKQTKEKIIPHPFFQNRTSAAVSKPSRDNFSRSASDIVPLRFGDCDSNLKSRKNKIYFGQCNKNPSLNDPSISNNHSPEFGKEHPELHNLAGLRRFPSCCSSPELTKSEKLLHFYHSLTRLPHSIHDGKTMRICTSIDSVVGLSEGYQKFSETTRSFLITKKTDVSFSKGKEIIKNFGLSAEFGGDSYHDLHWPSLISNCGQGVKIHSLVSYTDSEGKENSQDAKASEVFVENESSAETDFMDMDAFMDLSDAGVRLSRSSKAIKMDSRLSQLPSSSGVEIETKHMNTKLHDVNLESCALLAGGNAKDGQEFGSSETQSLDTELLLGHAEQTYNSVSDPCPDNSLKPDPSRRWSKRLKLIASDSPGLGVHSSNFEDLQDKKVNKLLKFTSEPAGDSSHGEEFVGSDKTATLERKCKSSLGDSTRRDKDLLLSQSWIRRWLHNQAGRVQKKTEAVVVCEPLSSKFAFEDFQKKQFPSVAAMALGGNSISGFQPCELQRRASYAVWNT